MNQINIISDYCKEKKGCIVKTNENLKEYTTFKIGGTANLVVFPNNQETLIDLLRLIKEYKINYILLGNGSNVLLCENNFNGVVIITSNINNIRAETEYIYAGCGVTLNKLASLAKENSLTGLEFAYGIPGTLGGAVYMNAGAYGGQMSDVVYSSEHINNNHEISVINADRHEFAYRKSVYSENNDLIILSSVLKLKQGDKSEIESLMNKNMSARREKQPLDYPSAGSVFKRGDGFFTAQLIDECGLKGYSIGGAQVSEKHAGFIVNKGNAKFSDVVNLIEHIKSAVYEKTGKNIECEIKIWKY